MASPTPNEKGALTGGGPTITRLVIVAGIFFSALFASAPLRGQNRDGTARGPQVRVEASTSIVNVCPGEEAGAKVRLRAAGVSPACAVRYAWSATGGRIVGDGPEVVWDFSGARPGEGYDVTLTVETARACGSRRVASLPTRVVVWSCPPRVSVLSRAQPRARDAGICPSIALCCRASVTPGLLAPFVATLNGGTPRVVPTFNWTLSAGEVAGGQGTNSILVDAKGLKAGTILATVEVGGYGPRCSATCLAEVARATPTTRPLTLSVSVKNARNGRPVQHARISVYLGEKPLGYAAETDAAGSFSSWGWAPGTYRVVVNADRFNEQESTVTLDSLSRGAVVFSLKPADAVPAPTPTPAQSPSPATTPSPAESPLTEPTARPVEAKAARRLSVSDRSSFLWLLLGLAALTGLGVVVYLTLAGAAAAALGPAAGVGGLAAAAGTTKEGDDVQCTVFGPKSARPGDQSLMQVFAHLAEQAGELAETAKGWDESAERFGSKQLGQNIERGRRLFFGLQMPGLEVDEQEQTLTWRGEVDSVQFCVTIPKEFAPKNVVGTVTFGVVNDEGVRVPTGHVKLMFKVVAAEAPQVVAAAAAQAAARPTAPAPPAPLEQTCVLHKRAFISYASPNRAEVEKRVQMLRVEGIECFMDVMTFQPGVKWESSIYQFIDQSDVFYLFWSKAARESEWVKNEVAYVLKRKHGDEAAPPEIKPVPLDDPRDAPPPDELKDLHFNDLMLLCIKAEEARRQPGQC
jgi:hypothetical protein